MSKKDTFHQYVTDLLSDIPGVTSKAMFSGYGFYQYGIIFGIIADGQLYFKVDDRNKKDFENAGSQPFTYSHKNKKSVTMSYWLVPEDVLENKDQLAMWVMRAMAASKIKKK